MYRDTTKLTKELKKFSRIHGADLFGVADLMPVQSFVCSHGPSWIGEFPRAVSIGMRLNDQIIETHTPHEQRRNSLYWFHVYDVVTRALDFLAYDVARWLNNAGFKTFPIPGSTPYNFDNLTGLISHKLVAHLAGSGWIGKSCLLLTEAFGPLVRFVSILTDAPLETGFSMDKPCGRCHVCVDLCPVAAFTGKEFSPDEGREIRFDVYKCSEYRREHPCGLCVSSCPKGKARKSLGSKRLPE
jgi:epoxyqueuosine reductase